MVCRLAIFVIVCFCFVRSEKAFSQFRNYSFQQFTEEQGLPQNFVYSLTQDPRGFLWVGTGKGLARYDGYEMKHYSVEDSLSADFITADYRTSSGNLIFGHNQGGITLFDGISFHSILPDTLGNKVVSITEDASNNLWIATQANGFLFIDITGKNITYVFPDVLKGQIVNTTFSRGKILFVGTNEGLFFFETRDKALSLLQKEVLPAYVEVSAIVPHAIDTSLCWIGTAFNGLYLLKTSSSHTVGIEQHFPLTELAEDIVYSIAQKGERDLWIGTGRHGVLNLRIASNRKSISQIKYFRKESGFPFTTVKKVSVDQHGQVWVSTSADGLFKIYKDPFTYFPFDTRFGVNEVRSVAATRSGYLVATDRGLVEVVLSHETGEYDVRLLDAFKDESITAVYTDVSKNTWIATETKGVFILAERENSIQEVTIDPENDPIVVRLFEEDNEGNLWISARANGIYALNKERKIIKHLTTATRFIHNDIFAIKADSHGNIWFGSYGAGLSRLDSDGTLNLFSHDTTFLARDINDIDEDSEGNIWIATEGDGFYRYSNGRFTHVGSTDNLVPPFVKGVKSHPGGRIWFSHRKGIGYHDLRTGKKYLYDEDNGLLGKGYSRSIIVDGGKNTWFCSDLGITLFENDSLSDARYQLRTYLTDIRIFFKNHPTNLQSQGLQTSMVEALPSIDLTHKQNHVTFDFVAVKLNGTSKVYYRHFLEGYDAEWTPPQTSTSITYTNLDPGTYVLNLQATDDLGTWVDPVTRYTFVITPPFWKRTWFYFLQIASVITLFSLTYLISKKRLATKRYVLRLMLFSCFFITLEYVENFIDPLASGYFDGAPIFRFFLNFLLALLLLPLETLITHWLIRNDDSTVALPATAPMAVTEEQLSMEQAHGSNHAQDEVSPENILITQEKNL